MKIPIRRMKKSDLIWLAENKCKAHHHSFLEHYPCLLRERPVESPFHERIGFLDLECTGLKANWDFILSYCLKELDGPILGRHVTRKEISSYCFDKKLTEELLADIRKFDRITTYYGQRFDIPFAKSRAEKWGLDFPAYRDLWQTDVYFIAKANLLLHSTRLEHVCNLLGIPAKGHKLEPEIWQKAQAGHEESLDWIHTHCMEDVTSLEAVWKRLQKYTVPAKRSL